jgi:hypothetical protein
MAFFKLAHAPAAATSATPPRRSRPVLATRHGAPATGHGALAFAAEAVDETDFTRF